MTLFLMAFFLPVSAFAGSAPIRNAELTIPGTRVGPSSPGSISAALGKPAIVPMLTESIAPSLKPSVQARQSQAPAATAPQVVVAPQANVFSIELPSPVVPITAALDAQPATPSAEGNATKAPTRFAAETNKRSLDIHPDPIEQLLRWEEQSNYKLYREDFDSIDVKVVAVDRSKVQVKIDSALPKALMRNFVKGGTVYWPIHPNAAKPSDPRWTEWKRMGLVPDKVNIPFITEPPAKSWRMRWTASRSMVMYDGESTIISVKAPTEWPHKTQWQPEKSDLKNDIATARYRSKYLDRMDGEIGGDPHLIILREILSVAEKKTKNGYVVRDLSPLNDGHYYLPAFSIPYVGRRIARNNLAPFAPFWTKNYAELLGRSKAKLLLRYGLQMETPNPQNMLIQLDRNLHPTGVLVFRDINDSRAVSPVEAAIGHPEILSSDRKINYTPNNYLCPEGDLSMWHFNEAGSYSVSRKVLERWITAHDKAYIGEILHALGTNPKFSKGLAIKSIGELQKFLFSDKGIRLLAKYHEELKAKHKGQ